MDRLCKSRQVWQQAAHSPVRQWLTCFLHRTQCLESKSNVADSSSTFASFEKWGRAESGDKGTPPTFGAVDFSPTWSLGVCQWNSFN